MSDKKPVRITLYHAEWCHYCKDFKPEWEKMKAKARNSPNVELVEYEESDLQSLDERERTINGEPVYGYPTIKISINGNESRFSGDRSKGDNIFRYVFDELRKSSSNAMPFSPPSSDSL